MTLFCARMVIATTLRVTQRDLCYANEPAVSIQTAVPAGQLNTADFAANVGEELKRRRRELGLRRRHLATEQVRPSTLRAVERGQFPLNRPILTQLSSAYGLDLAALLPGHEPLQVTETAMAMAMAMAEITVSYDKGSLTSIVRSYLLLLEQAPVPAGSGYQLRRNDIDQLADQLGLPRITIISRIATEMEASPAQTRAMVSLYLEGASVIGVHWVGSIGHRDSWSVGVVGGGPVEAASGDGVDAVFDGL
jgi:transcriptional regulator with XRE-family HTH domain